MSEGLPGGYAVKNMPASAGDGGSVPESGRSPGEMHDTPLQYPCLEKPMDETAWRATVHGVAKSQTRLFSERFKKEFLLLAQILHEKIAFFCCGLSIYRQMRLDTFPCT